MPTDRTARPRRSPNLLKAALICATFSLNAGAIASQCTATSAATQTPLVELYTSEGCSSCPPADRWLSGLKHAPDTVALAFHVDYWDYIGWEDRFAEPRNGKRQRHKVALSAGRSVYTPQIMVNGRDTRAWRGQDPLADTPRGPALAQIQLRADPEAAGNTISVRATAPADRQTQVVIARYENGHRSAVEAGENRGATLHHDFVVRDWESHPVPRNAPLTADVRFLHSGKPGGVVAFVEDVRNGEVLQALALPDCRN